MASGEMYFVEDPKSTCDILINSDGTVPLVTGNQEIVQSLKDELESNMTQWYLGYDWGIKLLQEDGNGLLDKKSTNDEIQEEIQRVISKNKNITHSEILNIDNKDTEILQTNTIADGVFMEIESDFPSPIAKRKSRIISVTSKSERSVYIRLIIQTIFDDEVHKLSISI